MKIYKLFKYEYCGGIGERVDETQVGYFADIDKASIEAAKLAKDGEDIVLHYPKKENKYGWLGLWMNLGGDEVNVPYDAYVIEEIEVN